MLHATPNSPGSRKKAGIIYIYKRNKENFLLREIREKEGQYYCLLSFVRQVGGEVGGVGLLAFFWRRRNANEKDGHSKFSSFEWTSRYCGAWLVKVRGLECKNSGGGGRKERKESRKLKQGDACSSFVLHAPSCFTQGTAHTHSPQICTGPSP